MYIVKLSTSVLVRRSNLAGSLTQLQDLAILQVRKDCLHSIIDFECWNIDLLLKYISLFPMLYFEVAFVPFPCGTYASPLSLSMPCVVHIQLFNFSSLSLSMPCAVQIQQLNFADTQVFSRTSFTARNGDALPSQYGMQLRNVS